MYGNGEHCYCDEDVRDLWRGEVVEIFYVHVQSLQHAYAIYIEVTVYSKECGAYKRGYGHDEIVGFSMIVGMDSIWNCSCC